MEDNETKPDQPCLYCGETFNRRRRGQAYCSDRCRKNASQRRRRSETPRNARFSKEKRDSDRRFFDSAQWYGDRLYSLPPAQRLGFMKELIDLARAGNARLRQIICNKYLLRAGRDRKWLFHNRCPLAYFTIAQAANRYCRLFWKASVRDVVYGLAPEPPTGEVTENVVTITSRSAGEVSADYEEQEEEEYSPSFLKSFSRPPTPLWHGKESLHP